MHKLLKKLLVPVAAIAALAVLAGCAGTASGLPKDPSQLTDQNVRDIVTHAVDNMLGASSFTGTYVSTESYAVTGNRSTLMPSVSSMNATILADRTSGRAHAVLGVAMTPADSSTATPQMQFNVDTYLYADNLYVNIKTVSGLPWFKVPVSSAILSVFSPQLFDNEVKMFGLPASVTYLRSETLDGTACYVIDVVPNTDQLLAMAERLQPQGTSANWTKLTDISQVYQDVKYTAWIAADSLRFLKVQSHAVADFGPDSPFGKDLSGVTITTDGTLRFTDYNTNVVINLPEAARQAQAVSPTQLPDFHQP